MQIFGITAKGSSDHSLLIVRVTVMRPVKHKAACAVCFPVQVIGTAAKANGYLSLIVQLEELECVTLMPVSQLLPSQLVQLCDEMQTGVPRFLYEGKPLRNQGYLGQQAVAALKVGRGPRVLKHVQFFVLFACSRCMYQQAAWKVPGQHACACCLGRADSARH